MCVCAWIFVCVCMCMCVCVCVCVCVYVYIYVCIYIDIYKYYMCSYIHIYIYVCQIFRFFVHLVEKMWLFNRKVGYRSDPDPKWFIPDPDPDPDPAKSSGSGSGSTTLEFFLWQLYFSLVSIPYRLHFDKKKLCISDSIQHWNSTHEMLQLTSFNDLLSSSISCSLKGRASRDFCAHYSSWIKHALNQWSWSDFDCKIYRAKI